MENKLLRGRRACSCGFAAARQELDPDAAYGTVAGPLWASQQAWKQRTENPRLRRLRTPTR